MKYVLPAIVLLLTLLVFSGCSPLPPNDQAIAGTSSDGIFYRSMQGLGLYRIYNMTNVTANKLCIANSSSCISSWSDVNGTGTGSGDITSVTAGFGLSGGGLSGGVSLEFDNSSNPTFAGLSLNGNLLMKTYNISNASCITLSDGQPMCWNTDELTLDIPSGLGNTIQVGQELTLLVKNDEGSIIYNGQLVYVSGAQGERLQVKLANACDSTKIHNIGVVTLDSCNDNAACEVTFFGDIRGLDLSAYADGDILYLSGDGSGNLTSTLPSGNCYHISVGRVIDNDSTNGILNTNFNQLDLSDEPVFNYLKILSNITINDNVNASGFTESGSDTLSNDISGNAATSTALAANGANCAAGNYPLGVDASGAVENCTADSDTTYTASGNYIYLSSTTFLFNETYLNITIDARDSDTTYTAGSGLNLSGTTFNHNDTSTQSSSDNSGGTFIQDVTLDTYGHVTSLATATALISGGTLTSGYHCRYDGTGIDCDRVEDASGTCAANAVCMGGHTHPGVNEVYGSGWNADTATPEKDDIYDWGHIFDTDDDGKVNVVDLSSVGLVKTDASGVLSVATSGTDYSNIGNTIEYTEITASTSTNWAGLVSDETGSGSWVFANTPTLVTPILGAATATTLDTGQGANELYDMDQNVLTTSNVEFNTTNSTVYYIDDGCIRYSGSQIILDGDGSGC